MADIISLKSVRKQKARSDREALAVENRIKFGRTKAEKTFEKAQSDLVEKRMDAHRRDEDKNQ